LGTLALSIRAVPRLLESQGCRAKTRRGTFRICRCADSTRLKGMVSFRLCIPSLGKSNCYQISNIKSRTFTVPDSIATTADGQPATTDRVGRVKLTPEERKRVEQLIRDAKSLADITRLEKELNEGRVPGGVVG